MSKGVWDLVLWTLRGELQSWAEAQKVVLVTVFWKPQQCAFQWQIDTILCLQIPVFQWLVKASTQVCNLCVTYYQDSCLNWTSSSKYAIYRVFAVLASLPSLCELHKECQLGKTVISSLELPNSIAVRNYMLARPRDRTSAKSLFIVTWNWE